MKRSFILMGIDDRPTPELTPEMRQCIRQATVFSGGLRHHERVASLLPDSAEWIDIKVPLKPVFEAYERCMAQQKGPIVVFASGDPLFFGFGNTLQREWPDVELKIFPSFHSLQLLAHRIPLRYDDMHITSLTGRPWQGLDRALLEHAPKIGVLTDRHHTPTTIAQRLLQYGYTYYKMYVGEQLGHPAAERVRFLSLDEAAQTDFTLPNCIILYAEQVPPRVFGIPDDAFEHLNGRTQMITKMPIRLLTLQALELPRRSRLWDIGFCTGSVSIEARLQFPHLQVCSFEIRPEGTALMDINSRRFGVPGIEVHIGNFLHAGLQSLPAPDAVFIGGHGGQLKAILKRVREFLLPGGCIVFNSVSPDSQAAFVEGIADIGLTLESSHRIALDAYNPITVLKATYHTI